MSKEIKKEKEVSLNLNKKEGFDEIMEERFGRYSKYIIQDRALPDVRDGLKPVQRRVLYAMYKLHLTHDKPHKKSARVVGDVIGKYHPHGDSSVYSAMVRMAQPWKTPHNLVDLHGNKGSIDGDPPAAMRYTEARLSKISKELLTDIDKETVSFILNFDDSETEPTVLPSMYPNLLVNGAKGISAGYATEIPPHNLNEIIDATILLINNPKAENKELCEIIKGPDFPTAGNIYNVEEIKKAYETGRGKIIMRANIVEETRKNSKILKIIDVPFEADKPNIMKKVEELIKVRNINGLKTIRDESDRKGIAIVIELDKNVTDTTSLKELLYKETQLQMNYSFNMVAIANKRPMLLGIKDIIVYQILHMKEVTTKKAEYELEKAKLRLEVLEGLIKAISILDAIIKTIRASKNKRDSIENLIKQFEFTNLQATAIVELRLHRLTSTDILELEKEKKEIERKIKRLERILNSEKFLNKVIIERLEAIKAEFGEERKTKIFDTLKHVDLNLSSVQASEKIGLVITRDGYLKRLTFDNLKEHENDIMDLQEGDRLISFREANNNQKALLITTKGNYVTLPLSKLTQKKWNSPNEHINTFTHIEVDEKIVAVVLVHDFNKITDRTLLLVSKKGMLKRVNIKDFQTTIVSRSVVCMKLGEEDELLTAFIDKNTNEDFYICAKSGKINRFDNKELSKPIGLRAAGVRGINLKGDDVVVSAGLITDDCEMILFYSDFSIKKKGSEFKHTGRNRVGVLISKPLLGKANYIKSVRLDSDEFKEIGLVISKKKFVLVNKDHFEKTKDGVKAKYLNNVKGVKETLEEHTLSTVD